MMEERNGNQISDYQQKTKVLAETLSHDLKTPLATAMGHLELAEETGDFDHLEKTKAALERVEAIIDDLTFVMEKGQVVNDIQSVELAETAQDVWEVFDVDDAQLSTEEATIQADEAALHRLLENLVKNALEHGGYGVTVSIATTDDGFYIEDDGPGIPDEDREEVLRPGFSTNDEGAGVGLTSVHQIALAHEWTMDVMEGSDGGARFEFSEVDVD